MFTHFGNWIELTNKKNIIRRLYLSIRNVPNLQCKRELLCKYGRKVRLALVPLSLSLCVSANCLFCLICYIIKYYDFENSNTMTSVYVSMYQELTVSSTTALECASLERRSSSSSAALIFSSRGTQSSSRRTSSSTYHKIYQSCYSNGKWLAGEHSSDVSTF